jgi:flavin-dependent dehydrogenase
VLLNGFVEAIERERDAWTLGPDLQARLVVFATGRASKVVPSGRWLTVDKLVGCMALLPCASGADATLRIDSTREGWWYTARADSHHRVVSFFTDGDLLRSNDDPLPQLLARGVIDAMCVSTVVDPAELAKAREVRVLSANTTFRQTAAGEGWLCCGDAAQTLDPLSSSGIVHALDDGINAARAVLRVLDGQTNALSWREGVRRERFAQFLRLQHNYYKLEARWPDAPFWQRRHLATALRRGYRA